MKRWSALSTGVASGIVLLGFGTIHAPYMPHAVCWRGDTALVGANFTANTVIFAAYMTISALLTYLDRRASLRKKHAFFMLFALFIFFCGLTHLTDTLLLWWPLFWLDVGARVLCAATSAACAVYLLANTNSLVRVLTYARDNWSAISKGATSGGPKTIEET